MTALDVVGATMVCADARRVTLVSTATAKSAPTTVLTTASADPTSLVSATQDSAGLIAHCECAHRNARTTEFAEMALASVTPASTVTSASIWTAWRTATETVFVRTANAIAMLTMLHPTANTCGPRHASTRSLGSTALRCDARIIAQGMAFA